MRLLFVHDGPLYRDDNGRYHEFSYHGLYERYSYLADEIVFLLRVQPLKQGEKYTILSDNIKVVGLNNFKDPKKYFRYKKETADIIHREVKLADIVVLRDSSAAGIAMKYVLKYNKPFIRECVGCSWDSMWNYGALGKILAPYSFYIQRKNIKRSPYVYYVTNEFLQQRYPTKGKTVGCSNVVISKVERDILEKRIEKIRNLNDKDKIVVGTAAAIDVKYKGQEYVIKAISQIKKQGIQVEYRLAGGNRTGNTYLKDLVDEYGVSDSVVFLGSLSSEQMMNFYDELDIYIQPSKQEGLPRAVIEAMSRGCPVIGTNIAGIPELIPSQCLFKKGSSREIVNGIKNILNSPMEEMAIRNYNKALEYTHDVLTARRNKFYDDFMAEYKL